MSPPSLLGMPLHLPATEPVHLLCGGRLYLKEIKYQTIFAVAKGRQPGLLWNCWNSSAPPCRLAPVEQFSLGDLMRNVGYNAFVGSRFQYRHYFRELIGKRDFGEFEVPAMIFRTDQGLLPFDREGCALYLDVGEAF